MKKKKKNRNTRAFRLIMWLYTRNKNKFSVDELLTIQVTAAADRTNKKQSLKRKASEKCKQTAPSKKQSAVIYKAPDKGYDSIMEVLS